MVEFPHDLKKSTVYLGVATKFYTKGGVKNENSLHTTGLDK